MSNYCDRIKCNCKYCNEDEGCIFYSQGSGNVNDMPCYVIEKEEPGILYLCNRKQPCSSSPSCITLDCMHTTKEEYALNGPCENPEESDRFNKWPDGGYVEKFFDEYKRLKENKEDK